MRWEDQGRQGHGWFGNGSSGVVAASEPQRDETAVTKQAVRVAVAHLPRRVRAEFEDFTGRDGGARMLEAMAVWTDAAGMDAAAFRRVAVGPGVSKEAAAALQAMGRALADASDPAAGQVAGEHLAAALNSLRPSSFSYDLCYAQDQAVYAAANGQVPDRAAPLSRQDVELPGQPLVLAAAGDLRCQGMPGRCSSGGSWGTTGAYSVGGRTLCRSCALKRLGATDSPADEKVQILRLFEK